MAAQHCAVLSTSETPRVPSSPHPQGQPITLCGITLAAAPPVARRTLLIQGSPPRLLTEGCSLLLLLLASLLHTG
jgi:hypothetical protein